MRSGGCQREGGASGEQVVPPPGVARTPTLPGSEGGSHDHVATSPRPRARHRNLDLRRRDARGGISGERRAGAGSVRFDADPGCEARRSVPRAPQGQGRRRPTAVPLPRLPAPASRRHVREQGRVPEGARGGGGVPDRQSPCERVPATSSSPATTSSSTRRSTGRSSRPRLRPGSRCSSRGRRAGRSPRTPTSTLRPRRARPRQHSRPWTGPLATSSRSTP